VVPNWKGLLPTSSRSSVGGGAGSAGVAPFRLPGAVGKALSSKKLRVAEGLAEIAVAIGQLEQLAAQCSFTGSRLAGSGGEQVGEDGQVGAGLPRRVDRLGELA